MVVRAAVSLHMLMAPMCMFRSGLALQVLHAGPRDKVGGATRAMGLTVEKEFHVRSLSLVVLLLFLASRSLVLGRGRARWVACHCSVASRKVREEDSVVDSNGDKDPRGILLLTENVRVDQDQDQSDTDEAGDVAEHLSFTLPGQLQV